MKCIKCGIPDTSIKFTAGKCLACDNYEQRTNINWEEGKQELEELLAHYRNYKGYDCVIAVSGGKDSYFLVDTMVNEWNMNPLLVTVADSFTKTQAGTYNLRNLIQHYKLNHYQYTINHDLFIRASRWAFEQKGTPLKFVEYAIYLIPFFLAKKLGINLVIFGENAAYEYGLTTHNTYLANVQINYMMQQILIEQKWWKEGGIKLWELETIITAVHEYPRCIYMSYFYPWSSMTNLDVAKRNGFMDLNDTKEWSRFGCMEQFEQIDSYGYMTHLWLQYSRLGYQRVTDIAVRRVREGQLTLKAAQKIIKTMDHVHDEKALIDFCNTLGYSAKEFFNILDNADWNKYYNKEK